MIGVGYAAARGVAARVLPRFGGAATHDPEAVEALIDAAFWASLRREEGFATKISLTLLPPDDAGTSIRFTRAMPLSAETLARLSAAVERPGIHLGVWRDKDDLKVWGATRSVPPFGFVLEVEAPGLMVIKYRRSEAAKYVNVAVLEGDQVKVLDLDAAKAPGCGGMVSALLGLDHMGGGANPVNVLVELSASMRAHGRGGALLVVPAGSTHWRESVLHPVQYTVSPPFAKLAKLMREDDRERDGQRWQDAFHRTVESIAGLTGVDGATVISDEYDVLAFGAKIRRAEGCRTVEEVIMTEPVEGTEARRVPVMETGGTRHLSAAQFAHDQRDSMALVASQDGRFTVFAWSECEGMVRAMRVETVLL
jgi:hypothetical protein